MDPSIMDFSEAAILSINKRDFLRPSRSQLLATRRNRETPMLSNIATSIAHSGPSRAIAAPHTRTRASLASSRSRHGSVSSSALASARSGQSGGSSGSLRSAGGHRLSAAAKAFILDKKPPKMPFYGRNCLVRNTFFTAGTGTTVSEDGKVNADLFYTVERPWAGMPAVLRPSGLNSTGQPYSNRFVSHGSPSVHDRPKL